MRRACTASRTRRRRWTCTRWGPRSCTTAASSSWPMSLWWMASRRRGWGASRALTREWIASSDGNTQRGPGRMAGLKLDGAGQAKMKTLEEATAVLQRVHGLVEQYALQVKRNQAGGTFLTNIRRQLPSLGSMLKGQF